MHAYLCEEPKGDEVCQFLVGRLMKLKSSAITHSHFPQECAQL